MYGKVKVILHVFYYLLNYDRRLCKTLTNSQISHLNNLYIVIICIVINSCFNLLTGC